MTVDKLSKALELTPREQEILGLLLKTEIDDNLFALMVAEPHILIEDIEPVATMSFRGNRPTDQAGWRKLIDLVKSF
jgi:hypothetical protein